MTHVFAGVLASGYTVAVDLRTRADDDTDAAPHCDDVATLERWRDLAVTAAYASDLFDP